jgi:hypothetical protein
MKILSSILIIAGSITHIWTAIIAFKVSGLFACILSILFPFISEVYWMIRMFGVINTYSYLVLLQLVSLIIVFLVIERN